MKNYFNDKKNIIIAVIVFLIMAVIIFAIFLFKGSDKHGDKVINSQTFRGQIIDDVVKLPNTVIVNSNEGEIVPRGEYNIKLQPQSESEQALITKAKFTLKESYSLAVLEAVKWSDDQKLVFIKSIGAIGLDGRSSSWQLVFASEKKNKNYEIIILEDKIVSLKELNSAISGYDLPINWYDSYEAIVSLRTLPQFSTSTISALSFYYSIPEASWAYGLANDEKTTSMWVK